MISNSEKDLKGFKDLKNKKLVLKDDDKIAKIWLDKNSYELNKNSSIKLLEELKKEKNDRRVVFNVFFGKSDYGIVTKEAWDIIVDFNPAIKKKVKVLEVSENIFIDNLGIYSKYSNKESRDFFFKKGNNPETLKSDTALKILDLLKLDGIFFIEYDFLNDLDKFFKEYFELEKRYK